MLVLNLQANTKRETEIFLIKLWATQQLPIQSERHFEIVLTPLLFGESPANGRYWKCRVILACHLRLLLRQTLR